VKAQTWKAAKKFGKIILKYNFSGTFFYRGEGVISDIKSGQWGLAKMFKLQAAHIQTFSDLSV
jgi:hypothetical protein